MSRDKASLLDIVEAARRIMRYVEGIERAELETDDEKQSAILYQIIVLGEAVKRLSLDFRARNPQVPWRQIAGMRDILTHQYDQVEIEVVWEVTRSDIPHLLEIIEPLVSMNEVDQDT